MPRAGVERPTTVGGTAVLERASPVVWFTFPGAWHDIGRFHTPAGRFTGLYANILTPVEVGPDDEWVTTDLFLDVFVTPAGAVHLLDEAELEDATARGWIDPALARAARTEADRLVRDAGAGRWPPPIVQEWPLARARDVIARLGP
jgi:predicted RNA-binding protein associated with RNAse of E/G family